MTQAQTQFIVIQTMLEQKAVTQDSVHNVIKEGLKTH